MTRFSKTILLLGTAVLALSACSSDKGPGKLGTKNDIVVKNNGMPSAAPTQVEAAKAPGEAFSSTVEQAAANPAPEVAAAEPVPAPDAAQTAAATAPFATDPSMPDNSPAMQTAIAQQQAANAPLPSTTGANPVDESTAPPSETNPIDAMAPTQPVNAAVTPPPSVPVPTPAPAAAPASSVYPAADYAATPAPTPAPSAVYVPPAAAVPSTVPYPLDKNAPYSPKAIAAAQAAAGIASTTTPAAPVAGTPSLTDATTIRAAQTALAAKAGYTGPQTGAIDAEFLNALVKYQNANNLPVGGVNAETLKSLGVTQ